MVRFIKDKKILQDDLQRARITIPKSLIENASKFS